MGISSKACNALPNPEKPELQGAHFFDTFVKSHFKTVDKNSLPVYYLRTILEEKIKWKSPKTD